MVVFPEPVGPTMATCCPGSATNDTPLRIHSSSLYANQTSLNSILARNDSMVAPRPGSSCGSSSSRKMRSDEAMAA